VDGRKRQQRAEATRGHLLAAARGVFAERGYHATSVAAITEAAATAHGTFYLYFKNKEDVFSEVMKEVLDELYRHSFTPFDELGDRFDPDRNVQRISAFLGVFTADGPLWRALLEAVLDSAVIEAQWLAHRARFQEGVADRIRRFQAAGTMEPFDADEVARALGGMLEWYAFNLVSFASRRPLEPVGPTAVVLNEIWARVLTGAPLSAPAPAAAPAVTTDAAAGDLVGGPPPV
jgi:AcrR family transcriptional regulator